MTKSQVTECIALWEKAAQTCGVEWLADEYRKQIEDIR